MKNLYTIIIIIAIFFPIRSIAAQTLSDNLRNYLHACMTMKEAMVSHDKRKMQSALSMFDELNIAQIPNESIDSANNCDEVKPSVFFIPEFADNMLLNNFVIADLDEVSMLRDVLMLPDVSVSHHGIKAGGSITYQIAGGGHMELLVITDGKESPEIRVVDKVNGKEFNDYSIDGSSSWLVWDMEKEGFFELSVINKNDSDATFVIAIN